MYWLIISSYLFFVENSFARSIKATADRLGSEVKNIGLSVGILGIVLAGIMLALGKQDAGAKFTSAILGILVIVVSSGLVSLIKGVA